jgi:hypothetical protein
VRCILLIASLENRLCDIAGLRDARPVDLWLLGFLPWLGAGPTPAPEDVGAHTLGLVCLDRAGVRLFFGHANFGQSVENRFALDLQFTR